MENPVFDDDGKFIDDPSEKAAKSKNVSEFYWVPPVFLAVVALFTFGGFMEAGWPLVIPIVLGVFCLLSIVAVPWFTNRK
jgi:hypothetical protein